MNIDPGELVIAFVKDKSKKTRYFSGKKRLLCNLCASTRGKGSSGIVTT